MPRRMFTCIAVLSAIGLLLAVPLARAAEVSHARIVRLSYAQGDVQLRADESSKWQKAVANTPLREGTSVATGDGRAEVEFEIGAMAWIASNTVIEFPQLVLEDGAKITHLTVRQGTATFYVNPGRHDSFVVQAGQSQIHAPQNSRFRVDVFEDGTSVSVLHGAVDVDAGGTTQRVNGKKTLAFRNDASSTAALSANPARDAWDRWVSDRDTAVEAGRSNTSSYLNTPFGYGTADLSFYGGWVNLPGYGYGWQPFGVGAGWSPFFNGYWSSFGAFGPTWISYEPWGWLPYHYGGWFFSPLYGWVWAPGNFNAWSPGTVYWMRTSTGVGWVARGPREAPTATTPMNLARGLVTNTPEGMLAHSPNAILPAAASAGAHVVGEWGNEGDLVHFSQQAHLATQTSQGNQSAPGGVPPAPRMPAGPAPRIASAGLLAGAVPRYRAPSFPGATSHGGSHGAGLSAPAVSPAVGGGTRASPTSSSGTHSGSSSSGSSGGHGKP